MYKKGTGLDENLFVSRCGHRKSIQQKQYQELQGCATNLGISQQTLSRWQKELRETGDIESRGSGNYASDEAKEITRLKRELRDAQDALEVLKKAINILGK